MNNKLYLSCKNLLMTPLSIRNNHEIKKKLLFFIFGGTKFVVYTNCTCNCFLLSFKNIQECMILTLKK